MTKKSGKEFQKTEKRLWLILFVIPSAIICIAAFEYYQQEKAKTFQAIASNEKSVVEVGKIAIERSFETLFEDTLYLSNYHDFRRFLKTELPAERHFFIEDVKQLMETRRVYDQIRWIDQNGMEVIRVEYKNGFPQVVPASVLENKKDRYYYAETSRLPQGAMYLSPFDLYVNHGAIEKPYKPMIRVATPVIGEQGKRRGIFIINYLGSELIDRFLSNTRNTKGSVMLLNSEGYWLKGEKGGDEFGFMFQRPDLSFAHRHPEAWEIISEGQNGRFEDETGLWTYQTVYLLDNFLTTRIQESAGSDSKRYFWKIVTFVPSEKLYEASDQRLIWIVLSSIAVLVAAAFGSFGLVYFYRRKQEALQEVKTLQEKTENLLLAVPDIIMQVDNDKRYVWANSAGYAFFGEDVIGKAASEYFEGDQDTYERIHPIMMDEIDSVYVESWQRRKDGEKRLLGWWCRNLKDANGTVTGALSTARDITEEFYNEEALSLQAHIIDAVQDSVMVHDAEGKFVYLNKIAWQSRGYTHDELMGMTVAELDAPEYTSGHPDVMKQSLEKMRREGSLKIEVEHLCKNGERLPVEVNAKLITLNAKEYILSSVRDIRERKASERIIRESEQKYRNLVEHAMIGVYRSDFAGNILYANPALVKLLAYDSPEELMQSKSFMWYKNPEEREVFIERLRESGHISNYEMALTGKNGQPVAVMVSASLEEGIISGMMIDIREIKQSRQEIEKLSKAIEQIDDIVYITDRFGNINYVNSAYCRHIGYSRDEVIGQNSRISKSGMHDRTFYKELWSTILSGEVYRNTVINRKKNGDLYYEKKTITPFKDDRGMIVGFVSTGKDVTEETMLHKEIERVATIDSLTGIYNRHKFEQLFALESERSRRFSQPLSIILIDIDHFKSVNDTYGHDVGDEVLKRLAETVLGRIRKIDIFARWGGEEFLLLCPGTGINETKVLAENLRVSVENALFPTVQHITISLGISTLMPEDSFSRLFKRADQGLYEAKENGRNRVGVIFS